MLILSLPSLLAGCWGDPDPLPVAPIELPTGPLGAALPPPPPRGVAEVVTPDTLHRASEVKDEEPPARLDVEVNFDHSTYEALGASLTAWGFSQVDGDGQLLRVDGHGPDTALRLAALPAVARVTPALDRNQLPDGSFRRGSERYGTVVHTWRWPDGAPVEQHLSGGAAVPIPELSNALPAGGRSCFGPLLDDLSMGVSVGVGWERALTHDNHWAVVVEDYGACDATGWMVLDPSSPVASVTFGGRSVADSDDAHFHDLAIAWLAKPQPDLDPGVMSAVQLLGGAENAVLARAVREAFPGQTQVQLLEAFTSRDPDGALAIAGGATTPILRAQALGQDEDARKKVLADPASVPSEVAAALVGWRPGAADAAALERFLTSPDPKVRVRAWDARFASTAGTCVKRDPVADAEQMYADCPNSRTVIVEGLRKRDPLAASKLLTATLSNPETVETGVAAVRAASAAGLWPALVVCVGTQTVSRDVRLVALQSLITNNRAEAGQLAIRHGNFLGLPKAVIPVAGAGAAPAVVDPTDGGTAGGRP